MRWDIFCRVIDNFGDIGVGWRLAADLAARGDRVRLWADDRTALGWMAPDGAPGVEVRAWPTEDDRGIEPHDAVIEAFGCRLPAGFVQRMALRSRQPVWINLEYLSAEDYVEQCHGLPSPQARGPGYGLDKWFFYPGFTERTGGLLREPDLAERRSSFDADAWRQRMGIARQPTERCVSLFCYANPALPALLAALAQVPTLLLVTPGPPAEQVRQWASATGHDGALRLHYLPALSQVEYDHLLWSCDLNCVRGEDSFVRAQWAGRPFLWQLYPQEDGAHATKLAAFQARFLETAEPELRAAVDSAARAWNGLSAPQALSLPSPALWEGWRRQCVGWRTRLEGLVDLASNLRDFAGERL